MILALRSACTMILKLSFSKPIEQICVSELR